MIPAQARSRLDSTPPYNPVAALSAVPTPDGTGHAVHPSVVDMGRPWNGYRFWMANTPYHNMNVQVENPIILASQDGLSWEVPAGLTNPIDPWPGGAGYNSDTELVYDPDNDRLICFWRDYAGGDGVSGNLTFCAATSSDSVTWSSQLDLIEWTFPDSGAIYSPAVVRVAAGDWRMWAFDPLGPCHVYTATNPLGTWDGPTELTFNGTEDGGVNDIWHGDVVRGGDGVFRMVANAPRGASSALRLSSSIGGIAWSAWSDAVISSRSGQWDAQIYRATLVPHDGFMRCWYGAYGADGQPRTGHATIPIGEWPTPPAP